MIRGTRRDKTLKGAGIGALSGAALSVALGKRKADEILTWASRDNLAKVAGVINEYKKTAALIQGHTDSTGSEAHNQDLSERRAGAVKGFNVVHGVDQDRLAATGFGEGDPWRATRRTTADVITAA